METRRIRLIVSVGAPGCAWAPGEIVELPADEAAKWADGERAVYVDDPPAKPKRATKKTTPPEGETGPQTPAGGEPATPPDGGTDPNATPPEGGTGTDQNATPPDGEGGGDQAPAG
jgi:hypothetical protein